MKRILLIMLLFFASVVILSAALDRSNCVVRNYEVVDGKTYIGFQQRQSSTWYAMKISETGLVGYTWSDTKLSYDEWYSIKNSSSVIYHAGFDFEKYKFPN